MAKPKLIFKRELCYTPEFSLGVMVDANDLTPTTTHGIRQSHTGVLQLAYRGLQGRGWEAVGTKRETGVRDRSWIHTQPEPRPLSWELIGAAVTAN